MRRRFLFIHNPTAGRQGRRLVHEVAAGLTHLGAEISMHTGAPDTLPGLLSVSTEYLDAVVAAGGDGTIRALAAHLQPYGLPLGIIPMGTGNVLANELGLPRTAVGLADLLLNGPVVTVGGARANGEPFFLMAGAGFDGEVIRHLDTPLKRRIGKAAYISPVLRALRSRHAPLQVTVDGQHHEAQWVVIANARNYGGAFVISPDAGIDRPGLIAVLARNASQAGLLAQLMSLGAGRLHRARGVTMLPCREVCITSDGEVASQIDGDAFGSTPLKIESGDTSVRIIVPDRFAARFAARVKADDAA